MSEQRTDRFQEIYVAQKALDLARFLSAPNQALLLSFFTRGSPSSLRIARAVAYHVLTNSTIQPVSRAQSPHHITADVGCQATYALPPLGPLVDVLSNPDEPFCITDSTDYDALTSRIAVLSVALSGIESYVAEETMLRKMAQTAVPEGSPRKKGSLPLELVRARLDAMHGKICTSAPSSPAVSLTKGSFCS